MRLGWGFGIGFCVGAVACESSKAELVLTGASAADTMSLFSKPSQSELSSRRPLSVMCRALGHFFSCDNPSAGDT